MDYFEYNEDENKSVCTVTTTEGLQCLIKIAGKFPTNLRKHLGKSHSEAFKKLEKKEEEKKHGECQSEKAKKSKCPPRVLNLLFNHMITVVFVTTASPGNFQF